ncbi:uncharacterized protein [Spinacia oleracea]|uniref:Retrotransposon gag domain-containing protein n=1 Tax=Spinacia oleracea TaxID=3562 RepID=A0ABM3R7Q6_SPIOL|nr:uncharacterized protein LOC130467229 [Spinacia oleracea]
MKPGATAQELWNRLEGLFHDNMTTQAIYLEDQFTNTRLEQFANTTEYCQQLKLLSDQLADVNNSISEKRMVLQSVKGLSKGEYDTIATMIQQSKPLPTFSEARSSLQMEERRRANQEDNIDTALVAPNQPTFGSSTPPANHHHHTPRGGGHHRGGRSGRGRGNGN